MWGIDWAAQARACSRGRFVELVACSAHQWRHPLLEPHHVVIGEPQTIPQHAKPARPPPNAWVRIMPRETRNHRRSYHSSGRWVFCQESRKEPRIIKHDIVVADQHPVWGTVMSQILPECPTGGAKVASVLRRRQEFDIVEPGKSLSYTGNRAVIRIVVDDHKMAPREPLKAGCAVQKLKGTFSVPKIDSDDQDVRHDERLPSLFKAADRRRQRSQLTLFRTAARQSWPLLS